MARKELRKERYRYLRERGFSTKEANRYRDRSTPAINRLVSRREKSLEKRPPERLNEKQREQLEKLRRVRQPTQRQEQEVPEEREDTGRFRNARIESKRDREANFKRWSKAKAFPADYEDWISEVNRANGKDPLDSFGYRVFYHRYVNGLDDREAMRIVESRNT